MNEWTCPKCEAWRLASLSLGYRGGMCGECFDERYVALNLTYDPYEEKNSQKLSTQEKND